MAPPARKTFAKGSVIFREGDSGTEAYLVQQGAVRIFKTISGRRVTLGTVLPGGVFGELALIDNGARMAGASASDDTICLVLSQASMLHMLDSAPEGLTNLLKSLIGTMRTMGDELAHARAELAELKGPS